MEFNDDPEFLYLLKEKTLLIEVVSLIVWKYKQRFVTPPTYDNIFNEIQDIVFRYRPELYDDRIFHSIMFLLKEDFLFRDFLLSKKKCCFFR